MGVEEENPEATSGTQKEKEEPGLSYGGVDDMGLPVESGDLNDDEFEVYVLLRKLRLQRARSGLPGTSLSRALKRFSENLI